jgi:multidrug efflux system membrane fusion protein
VFQGKELPTSPNASRRRGPLVAGIAVVAIVALVVWRTLEHRATAAQAAAHPAAAGVPVVTARATREDVPIYLTGIGTAQPAQTVTVKARVDGQLETLAFDEGKDVKKGDLLAQIDPRPFQAALDQAVAQRARDEAQLQSAKKDLERYTTLVAQDSIPRQTLDTQQALVGQLTAAIQADDAAIASARVQLSYTTIRAPLSGRTGMRMVDVGNIVHASDANGLVVINEVDPIAIVFTLPEDSFRRVNDAIRAAGTKPLVVRAYARDDGSLLDSGHLVLVNNQIDVATGTFQLKATFANPKHALWPGQDVNVRLVLGERKDATTVPGAAVQRGANGLLAYVVKPDDSVDVRPIKVAVVQDGKAVIDEGISAGTRVIVDGQYKVRPGARVVEAAAPGASRPRAMPAPEPAGDAPTTAAAQ